MASSSLSLNSNFLNNYRHSLHQETSFSAPIHCLRNLPSSTFPKRRLNCNARSRGVRVVKASVGAAESEVARDRTVREDGKILRVGIICGGPSPERGISLNSARSVLDHIQGDDLHVSCYYIDCNFKAYAISNAQVYSNTPADFDFKLESLAQGFKSLSDFVEHLATSVDIVFPVIHGRFGEDGGIQELLEKSNIPFVGTPSNECRKAFDKHDASLELDKLGFITVPSFLVQAYRLYACVYLPNVHSSFNVVMPSPIAGVSDRASKFSGNQYLCVPSVVLLGGNWKTPSFPNGLPNIIWTSSKEKLCFHVIIAGKANKSRIKHWGYSCYGVTDALTKANAIISEGIDDKVLVEIFLEGGREFTTIVLDVGSGLGSQPVALLPTEVAYHTPPRFPEIVIRNIREGASSLFQQLGLRDFARIDGWFLPPSAETSYLTGNKLGRSEFGTILFTDINLISGMEQTSFLFQQASKVGFSHSNILRTVIQRACLRFPNLHEYSVVSSPILRAKSSQINTSFPKHQDLRKVFVTFGGDTSERQVSLMSGTNVWLNLQAFDDLEVIPCLLAPTNGYQLNTDSDKTKLGESSKMVWTLPYSIVLRHTTEEVLDACIEAIEPARAALTSHLRKQVMEELMEGLKNHDWFRGFDISDDLPKRYSLDQWVKQAKEVGATVFIAGARHQQKGTQHHQVELYRGSAEDSAAAARGCAEQRGGAADRGAAQRSGAGSSAGAARNSAGRRTEQCLERRGAGGEGKRSWCNGFQDVYGQSCYIPFSPTCMLADSGVLTITKDVRRKEDLLKMPLLDIWHDLTSKLGCETLCVKPARDGCSTGVARLRCNGDLTVYVKALENCLPRIPPNSLSKAHGMIEMPYPPPDLLIFEPFIETDEIIVSGNAHDLLWKGNSRWVEITVGVIGERGSMRSLTPSITVKESGDILSLEEKFQGGTGINLTPPPLSIMSNEALEKCKEHIELIANTLELEGFSRIDAFVNVDSGEVLIIEVNTVPGMTPSTVLIHQALAEEPPVYPHRFFRTLLDLASERSS
ncbi:D-alanine--D-alanine ligase A [Sesamum angolense]|uniref:D-alanine--D-alanine ligase A n=1 Tax=Sesamum angolense TaxID=2727404 RepID=A0AAE1WMZ0_9LAMI|nr:D-alanine--D-alanine ligase A [Sesamum angolense]